MKIIKTFLLFIPLQLLSQNLVLNPSFESSKMCVENFGRFNQEVFFWSTPTLGTTDFFNTCNRGIVGIPTNFHGKQNSLDGANYAGCYFFAPNNYREYIQGKLQSTLEQGKKYRVSFYINLSDNSIYSIKNIDFLFTDKKTDYMTDVVLNQDELENTNQSTIYRVNNENFYNEKNNWTLISTEIIGKGNENYIVIGNFNKNSKTEKRKIIKNKNFYMSYYYIDMVSVELIDKKGITKIDKKENIELELDKEYIFENVTFDFNSTELKKEAKAEINMIYNFLKENKATKILIMGHTDNVGNGGFNKTLSENRAKSVMEYLLKKGLNKNRISSTGYGNTKPIDTNETETGRTNNRRVEFKIIKHDNSYNQ